MIDKKRIGRNIGRIELLAVMTTVKSMMESGYDRKKIHDRLITEGRVSMSYQTFCYQLKQFPGHTDPAASVNLIQRPKNTGPPKADPSEPFTINSRPKAEELIGAKK